MANELQRFWSRIAEDPETGCWVWTGSVAGGDNKGDGYGRFLADGRFVAVHRWAYERWVGVIPEGLELDHLCRVRRCCNPAHLEPVTRRENLHRGQTINAANSAKTHCPQGHPYDDENTYWHPTSGRNCKTCNRERVREWLRRKRRPATVSQ